MKRDREVGDFSICAVWGAEVSDQKSDTSQFLIASLACIALLLPLWSPGVLIALSCSSSTSLFKTWPGIRILDYVFLTCLS